MVDGVIEVHIEARGARFDPLDDRWTRDIDHLFAELRAELGPVATRRIRSLPARKGGVEDVVLSLGSAGALTAAVEIVRAWLARDRSRFVRLSWHADGRLHEAEFRGSQSHDAAVEKLLAGLATRLDQTD